MVHERVEQERLERIDPTPLARSAADSINTGGGVDALSKGIRFVNPDAHAVMRS